MKKLLFFIFIMLFCVNLTANAQKENKKNKEEKEEKLIVKRQSLIFTKYASAWQIGVFGGVSTLIGDVSPAFLYGGKPALPGHNYGFFVSKSWTYLFSTRLKYSNMVMFTNDAAASTLTSNQYNYLKERSSGLNGYNPGDLFFHNSRTQAHDVNLDLVFSIGNINFNKDRSLAVFKIFPSVGFLMYQTFYDQLDANGNAYDYASVENLNNIGSKTRADVYKALASMRDGKYETHAEEHMVDNEEKWAGYNGRFVFGLGAGVAFRLTKFMSLDIETRQMFAQDDLIDGMQWQEPAGNTTVSRGTTNSGDSYNQTTVGLTFSLIGKNIAESKNMDNPLSGSDAFSKKKGEAESDKPKVSTNEELDSVNAVLEEKLLALQDQINGMEMLLKMMAEKEQAKNEAIEAEKKALQEEADRLKAEGGLGEAKNTDGTNAGNSELDKTFRHRNGDLMYVTNLEGSLKASYYLIIGSFRIISNANRDQRNWSEKGVNTVIMFDPKEGLNRLVVDYTNDHKEALDMLDEYRATLNKDIWIIKSK